MEIVNGIHHFDCGPFNWYLIEENARFTLVDAGFPGHYKILLQGLDMLGRSIRDIEAIVLTHAHADHIGFAEKLRTEAGIPVFIHKDDKEMARKPLQLPWAGLLSNVWRPYTAGILGIAVKNGVFTMPYLTKVELAENNKTLDIPGKPRVLHTPGHTNGEICLFFESKRALISGDTIVTRNLLSGKLGSPQIANRVLTHNYRQAMHSLHLLREIGPVTLLPGHGTIWEGNMTEAVEIALDPSHIK